LDGVDYLANVRKEKLPNPFRCSLFSHLL
jgi:hypothetical protein